MENKNFNSLFSSLTINPDSEISKGNYDSEGMTQSYQLNAKAGEIYRIKTLAAMVAEIYHPSPEQQAVRMVGWGKSMGFEKLRQDNREIWRD